MQNGNEQEPKHTKNTMEAKSKGYDRDTSVNGFDLSYDDVGEGSIPVIFLHGYPFDKTMWREQLDFLQASGRVIAMDVRGFGESTDEESSLTVDLFTDDLIKFMDKLGIEKAIVCGLSMGGYIALNAQKRFPDRFEAIILCDTQCIADTPEAKEKRYKIIDEIAVHGVADFNEGFIKSVFHNDSLRDKKELVAKLRGVVFSNSQHIIIMGLKALAERSETCSSLGGIDIPTLIICGREDTVTPLAQSEFMHSSIEGSILRIIENAGHVSNLEQAHEFNEYLLSFITSISRVDAENFSGDLGSI